MTELRMVVWEGLGYKGWDERLYDMIFFAEAAPRGGWNYDTFD